jgi:hypothetical protein
MIDAATILPATSNNFDLNASVLCKGRYILSFPSNKWTAEFGERSCLRRRVKNSRLGPPPSIAGSPSNVILTGVPKLKSLCLKNAMLSDKIVFLLTINRIGALVEPGMTLLTNSINESPEHVELLLL